MKLRLPLSLASFLTVASYVSATIVTDDALRITFLNNAPVVDMGLTGTVTTYKSPSATSQDFSSQTECGYLTSGSALNSHTIFAPNVNPANGGQWQATLTLTGLAGQLDFSGIQLATMGYDKNGNYQTSGNPQPPKGTTADGSAEGGKYVGFTVEYSRDGQTWTQVGPTYAIDMVVPASQEATETLFAMDGAASYAAGDTVYLRVTTSQDYTAGTFAGLQGITLIKNTELADVSWTGGDGLWTDAAFGSTAVEGGSAANYFTFGSEGFSPELRTATVTLDSSIAPGGILVDAGEGNTYRLEGEGGFSGKGALNIASGTLQIATAANDAWTGTISIGEGAVLELQTGQWDLSGKLNADSLGTLVLSGSTAASVGNTAMQIRVNDGAVLTLTGAAYGNVFSGDGTIKITANTNLEHLSTGFSGLWQVENGKTLTVAATAAENGQMALSGSGSWEMLGTGTVTLAGAPEANAIGNLSVGKGNVNILQNTNVTGLLSMRVTGSMTIGNGTDAVTVTTTRLRGADSGSAGNQTLTIAQNASLVVTGSANGDGDARNASILLGHWVGALEMTIEGTMTAEQAKVYMTHSGNAAGTRLIVAGTGTLNALGISKDSHGGATSGGTVVLQDGARMNLGSAGLSKVATFEAGAATVGSFADAWTSSQDIALTSARGLIFHTGKYDLNSASYSETVGTTITMSGVLSDAEGVAGSVVKTGVGTLVLQGANTYTGQTVVERGTLSLEAGGSLGSGELTVKNAQGAQLTTQTMTVTAREGGDATVSGLAAPVTAAATVWEGASASPPAHVRRAEVTLTSTEGAYRFEHMTWEESALLINQAASVELAHVTLAGGTTLGNAGGAALTVSNSALILSEKSLSQPPSLGEGSIVALNYDMAGATVTGSFTLDFTTDLLRELATLTGEPLHHLQITLENVTAWDVENQNLLWGDTATWLQPTNVTVSKLGNQTVVDVEFARAIPEPTAAAMGLLGWAALLLRRRRRIS